MILPASFFETTSYFGLSVSRASLKAVSVAGNQQVIAYAQQPIVEGSGNDTAAYTASLVTALEHIKTQGNFTTPYVAVVLPETYAFSKEFSLPTGNMAEFAEGLSWQIGDLFPFAADSIYTDWKLLSQTKDKITALVVAIPQNRIDPIRNALATVKLFPVSFEPAISALSRISTLKDKQLSVLIDINQSDHSISLIEGGISLVTTTNLNHSGENNLAELVSNIQQLLIYHQDKVKAVAKQYDIIVTGDKASDAMAASLQAALSQPASMLSINAINPGFHQAFAAAASQIMPPEDTASINLLPVDLRDWYQNHHHLTLLKTTARVLTILMSIGILVALGNGIFLNSKESQLATPTPAEATINLGEYKPADIVGKANRIITLFPQKTGPQETLMIAISAVPPTVKIESFAYDETKQLWQFIGSAGTRDDILLFKANLESSGKFSQINLPIGPLTTKENVDFSIEFTGKPAKL